jgi:diaminohydroxyphosphoribosylaminopyrimidine deaminase / 5-amino-6-(5-phosphoribosylamino)uracil reductase
MLAAEDARWMDRAVHLGRRGWGRVHPNPMVGCVLVRDGAVVGEGWHALWGGPHAEVEALRSAGDAARGAVAYVSLEPCRHQGKTPPCTLALEAAGVRRVVFGAADPGVASGGGGEVLQALGIEVAGPVLSPADAHRENPVFFHRDPDRPWTVLKLAVSLDGGLAEGSGVRTPLTGDAANEAVHHLRAGVEGILVGTRTAQVDDPLLTVRGRVVPRVPPIRIVVDLAGRLSPNLRMLREGDAPVWIVTGAESAPGWRTQMERAGARVLVLGGAPDRGEAGALQILRRLRSEGVSSLLCEGGGRLAGSLLQGGGVDRLVHIWAPRVLGAGAVPAFPALGLGGGAGQQWRAGPQARLGGDLWVEWDRIHARGGSA